MIIIHNINHKFDGEVPPRPRGCADYATRRPPKGASEKGKDPKTQLLAQRPRSDPEATSEGGSCSCVNCGAWGSAVDAWRRECVYGPFSN